MLKIPDLTPCLYFSGEELSFQDDSSEKNTPYQSTEKHRFLALSIATRGQIRACRFYKCNHHLSAVYLYDVHLTEFHQGFFNDLPNVVRPEHGRHAG